MFMTSNSRGLLNGCNSLKSFSASLEHYIGERQLCLTWRWRQKRKQLIGNMMDVYCHRNARRDIVADGGSCWWWIFIRFKVCFFFFSGTAPPMSVSATLPHSLNGMSCSMRKSPLTRVVLFLEKKIKADLFYNRFRVPIILILVIQSKTFLLRPLHVDNPPIELGGGGGGSDNRDM